MNRSSAIAIDLRATEPGPMGGRARAVFIEGSDDSHPADAGRHAGHR
ncbi:hypothetical protein [Microlunatus soli]|nr:hypothetical protein [Microlunatus soli]